MSQNNNHQTLKLPKNQLFLPVTAVFFTTLFALFVLNFLQVFTPDNSYAATHTDEASGKYNNTEYSLTTTVSDLDLELTTLPTGTASTYGSQTVNVETNAPGGYILYMSTSGDLANSNTSSDDKISSITGTNSALDTNTWGYTSESLLSSAGVTLNDDFNSAAEQSIWNKLPVSTDTSLTSVASSTSETEESGEDSTLYYGIKADSSLDDGDYQGTITYTTIANDAVTDTLLSVSPTSGTAGAATTITITTSLMTTSSSITASDIIVTFTNTSTSVEYSCDSVSITSASPLTITCNTPTSLTAGSYNVEVKVNKYNKTYAKTSAYTAEKPDDGTLNGATYMHDSSIASRCEKSAATTSIDDVHTYELTDIRSSQKYYIRKFVRKMTRRTISYCIMVENLYFEDSIAMDPDYSNVTSAYTLPESSTANFGKSGSFYSGGRSRDGAEYDGSYFSWNVAGAGTVYPYAYTVAKAYSGDICPKEWAVVSAGDTVYTLVNDIGIRTFFADKTGKVAEPNYPGVYKGSTLSDGGSAAQWWGDLYTYYGDNGGGYNYRVLKDNKLTSSYYSWRTTSEAYNGLSVRCSIQVST